MKPFVRCSYATALRLGALPMGTEPAGARYYLLDCPGRAMMWPVAIEPSQIIAEARFAALNKAHDDVIRALRRKHW